VVPLLSSVPGGVTAREARSGWSSPRPVELTLDCGTCTGSARVRAGDTLRFALHRSTLEETPARVWSDTELAEAMDETVAAWRSWSALHQTYEGPSRDLVHTSGRVLQALKFQPSGAIVAAATTSLPEGVGGEYDLSERTLSHLSGWRNSRPVRVGDGAWDQQQVDVYGELLGAAHRLVDHLHDLDPQTRSSLGAVADAAAARWKEKGPGHLGGLGGAPALLHSKVMCWFALNRAIALSSLIGDSARVADWEHPRDEIFETVVRTAGATPPRPLPSTSAPTHRTPAVS